MPTPTIATSPFHLRNLAAFCSVSELLGIAENETAVSSDALLEALEARMPRGAVTWAAVVAALREILPAGVFIYRGGHHVAVMPRAGDPQRLLLIFEFVADSVPLGDLS